MTTGTLAQRIAAKEILILDGAMGTELQRRGADTSVPLWSARALIENPDIVTEIHEEYIEAGADIITTNTFRTTRRTCQRARRIDDSAALTRTAVELAQRARDRHPERDVLIAGSIAPLEDCYRPDLVPDERELAEEHAELAHRLREAGVDLLLLETMNTSREAQAACAAASSTGCDVIASFICDRNGNLYGGDSLAGAVRALEPFHPTAYSLNCVSPRYLDVAIARLKQATLRPFAVYANVGVPEEERGWTFTREINETQYASFAIRWRTAGASIVGGCCGTTPAYIAAVVEALRTPTG